MVAAPALTNFQAELERLEKDIGELEARVRLEKPAHENYAKYVYRLYQRASLSGDLRLLRPVETAIDQAIGCIGPAEDLCLLKANLHMKLHRLADAGQALALSPLLPNRIEARGILADIAFQTGRYFEARREYEAIVEADRSWENLARLAHFESKFSGWRIADQLYSEAEDEITAKQMRSYAWVQLQRGLLDLARGAFNDAADHYDRAARAYSGFWMVDEHVADLLAAQRQFGPAARLYEQVFAIAQKPETLQKLGLALRELGEAEAAERCFDHALELYLESADRGEIHYWHHLTEFFTDVRPDCDAGIMWAAKDKQERNNFETSSSLAWALYQAGRIEDAAAQIEEALSAGVRDARLFQRASQIYSASGDQLRAHELEHKARELNPGGQWTHTH